MPNRRASRLRSWFVRLLCCLAALAVPSATYADATAFLGVNMTPSTRATRGFAVGVSLLIVGFEFEYSDTVEKFDELAPSLRTGMGNVFVQTPFPIGGLQFYATTGGGLYRERLGTTQETNIGANVGGGVKVSLLGPLRLRLDYRVFTLRGSPQHEKPQRFYAGLNLMF